METQHQSSTKIKSTVQFRVIMGIVAGAVLSAVILLVELLININTPLQPGAYEINADNYDKFIVLSRSVSNYHREVKEGEKEQTSMVGVIENNRAPMFRVVPKFTKSNPFRGAEEELSYLANDDSRYQISDLRMQLRFTYSLNGVESTETVEVKIGRIEDSGHSDTCVYLTAPDEAIAEAVSAGIPTGYYFASFDYWYVEITDISGFAEVKEVAES